MVGELGVTFSKADSKIPAVATTSDIIGHEIRQYDPDLIHLIVAIPVEFKTEATPNTAVLERQMWDGLKGQGLNLQAAAPIGHAWARDKEFEVEPENQKPTKILRAGTVDFADRDMAEAWARQDNPSVTGIFGSVSKPLAEGELNYAAEGRGYQAMRAIQFVVVPDPALSLQQNVDKINKAYYEGVLGQTAPKVELRQNTPVSGNNLSQ